jgi:hypothetical protein
VFVRRLGYPEGSHAHCDGRSAPVGRAREDGFHPATVATPAIGCGSSSGSSVVLSSP